MPMARRGALAAARCSFFPIISPAARSMFEETSRLSVEECEGERLIVLYDSRLGHIRISNIHEIENDDKLNLEFPLKKLWLDITSLFRFEISGERVSAELNIT